MNNVHRTWREIRDEDYAWVTPKVFRKTAATVIERTHGADAAVQLGYSSSGITRKRRHVGPFRVTCGQ